MKRIQSACICQTLHFQLKEGVVKDYAMRAVQETDGSIVIKIIKQYNSAPVGDYLN